MISVVYQYYLKIHIYLNQLKPGYKAKIKGLSSCHFQSRLTEWYRLKKMNVETHPRKVISTEKTVSTHVEKVTVQNSLAWKNIPKTRRIFISIM